MPPRAATTETKQQARELMYARGLLQEKEFPQTDEVEFYNVAIERGFGEMMKKREDGNATLVREFYATTRVEDRPMMKFRKLGFYLEKEHIQDHYGLPDIPECRYQFYKQNLQDVPWDDVIRTLCIEGGDWSQKGKGQLYLERKVMNDEARVWLNFMCYNVTPVAHLSDTTKLGALLMYLLMKGEPVDIPQIVLDAILQCARTTRNLLVFPHLISEICIKVGVPVTDDDDTFEGLPTKCYKPINKKAAEQRSRKKGKRVAEEEPPNEEDEARETSAPAITMESLSQQIALLQDSIDQRFTTLQNYVLTQEARRQQFFDPLMSAMAGQMGIPFPPGFEQAFMSGAPGFRGPFEAPPGSSTFHPGDAGPSAQERGQDDED